ncbi:F-box domain-containing protein [Mycena venus]|uniref:F-box domain-containing protein n=1 Tax=Mycena venus TaxID=2733690 RepID=A0A8H6YNB5_9AGAR|nr:F-box domain-containing protein [Mycena venus]
MAMSGALQDLEDSLLDVHELSPTVEPDRDSSETSAFRPQPNPFFAASRHTQETLLTTSLAPLNSSSSVKETNSPIQRLPVELFHEIFLACLPSATFTPAGRRQAPLLLSWVCTYWRRMALSFPKLWSSPALEPPHPADDIFQHTVYLSQSRFWISRAGRRNLYLSFTSRPSLDGRLTIPTGDYMAFIMVEGYMQRCTKLELNFSISTEELFQIFRHAFVLTEASFLNITHYIPLQGPPLEVENLHTLKINTGPWIFGQLLLPSLRHLTVSYISSSQGAWPLFTSLLERSHCRLESLSYSVTHPATEIENSITEFLQHPSLHDLRRLVLRDFLIPHEAIEALTVSSQGHHLMPMLAELDLGYCHSFDGTFAAMVASRFSSSIDATGTSTSRATLKSVTVLFYPEAHPQDISQLNALALDGLQVEIRPLD